MFERRMNQSWPSIVRLIERLLAWPGSTSDAEDVAQDVFVAAWRGRKTFRGEAAWETWVYAIAVKRARNAARSRRRRQRWFGRLLPGSEIEADVDIATEAPDRSVSGATQHALNVLSHVDRELLVLRYLEERSVDEIMALLDLTRAAADARLSRARRRFKGILDGAPDGSGDEL